jgi:hypothetical protein
VKRFAILAGGLVFALVLPLVLAGALVLVAEGEVSPSEKALEEIPPDLISVYQAAASTCDGLEWTVLAAIHKVETGFGTGPATSHKGAQGPMQFLPSTWAAYAVDGDGDGVADINNVVDAIFGAANLLCANGAGDPGRLATAVWNYNRSQSYVDRVLTLASSYGVITTPAGVAHAGTADLLNNPRVVLTPRARGDLEAGIVDARLVSLLAWISERHAIGISVFKTGHAKYVRGTNRISNHYYGRAADIFSVDGAPVSRSSFSGRQLVLAVASVEGPLRPSEVGHPFGDIRFSGGFSDADHSRHIHLGYR